MLLVDAPEGPLGLIESSTKALEDFLDVMAVLIATLRFRSYRGHTGSMGSQANAGGLGLGTKLRRRGWDFDKAPGAEAASKIRTPGTSLRSEHLSGEVERWLATAGM